VFPLCRNALALFGDPFALDGVASRAFAGRMTGMLMVSSIDQRSSAPNLDRSASQLCDGTDKVPQSGGRASSASTRRTEYDTGDPSRKGQQTRGACPNSSPAEDNSGTDLVNYD
jgi:hypothetical protein